MEINPIASESLGVRSQSFYLQTEDISIILDPGISLAPRRFGLKPHKIEYKRIKKLSSKLIRLSKQSDALFVSHYHFDHYTPNFENYIYNWSNEDISNKIFKNKLVFAKHTSNDINYSQSKRGYYFEKLCKDVSEKLEYVDGRSFKIGDTKLVFSDAVPHGAKGTKLGNVLMAYIDSSNDSIVYASDTQGPIFENSKEWILEKNPDLVILGGPPKYLVSNKLDRRDYEEGISNLKEICEKYPTIIDHHLLRSQDGVDVFDEIRKDVKSEVWNFATYLGQSPEYLEKKRKILHENKEVPEEFYGKIKEGYYLDNEIRV